MSLLPFYYDYDSIFPRRMFDQNFGLMMPADALLAGPTSPVPRLRPWWPSHVGSSIKADKDKWQINVDVQHFSPEEITVKSADGFIVIEGKHEDKKDEHGYISRQFCRRFKLPEDLSPDMVESRLSSDGVLTVIAPRKIEAVEGERAVPITQTGPVRKYMNGQPKEKQDEENK